MHPPAGVRSGRVRFVSSASAPLAPAAAGGGRRYAADGDAGRHGRFLTCGRSWVSGLARYVYCCWIGSARGRRNRFSARGQRDIDHLLAAHTARFQHTAELSADVSMLACPDAERDLLRGSRFRRRRLGCRRSATGENAETAGTARPRQVQAAGCSKCDIFRPARRDRPGRPSGPGY